MTKEKTTQRTKVKDLPKRKKELTKGEQKKIKGGSRAKDDNAMQAWADYNATGGHQGQETWTDSKG